MIFSLKKHSFISYWILTGQKTTRMEHINISKWLSFISWLSNMIWNLKIYTNRNKNILMKLKPNQLVIYYIEIGLNIIDYYICNL